MKTRLDELRAMRLRLAEERPRLQQQLCYARLRAAAVMEDAKATVMACRSALARRKRPHSKHGDARASTLKGCEAVAVAADRSGS